MYQNFVAFLVPAFVEFMALNFGKLIKKHIKLGIPNDSYSIKNKIYWLGMFCLV